jgi:pteridine reductase
VNPTGKTALITGGARRVGRAITLALARAGADVVINYHHSAEEAQETAAEARALGVEALPYRADVADLDQVRALVAAARERFGAVDILVNNASLFATTPVPSDNFESWHRVLQISLDGPFYLANLLAPAMQEQGEGAIVNLVDLAAWEPWRGFAAHAVGKAGLLALTRQLALEFSPAVRVNAVAPGRVLPPPYFTQAQVERGAQRSLLGHWGTPDDAAQAVLFLIRSSYITGEVIVVDGGERYTPP